MHHYIKDLQHQERILNPHVSFFYETYDFARFLKNNDQFEEAINAYTSIINKINNNPWKVTFSYGRALQLEAMKKWSGNNQNIIEAQKIISKRAYMNSLAASGKYDLSMESI